MSEVHLSNLANYGLSNAKSLTFCRCKSCSLGPERKLMHAGHLGANMNTSIDRAGWNLMWPVPLFAESRSTFILDRTVHIRWYTIFFSDHRNVLIWISYTIILTKVSTWYGRRTIQLQSLVLFMVSSAMNEGRQNFLDVLKTVMVYRLIWESWEKINPFLVLLMNEERSEHSTLKINCKSLHGNESRKCIKLKENSFSSSMQSAFFFRL